MNTTFESLPSPSRWPTQFHSTQHDAGRTAGLNRLYGFHHSSVYDFTPNYLSRAYSSLEPMRRTYGSGAGLQLVVALRDPVARAFSEYCMFAPSWRQLREALRTRAACSSHFAEHLACQRPKAGACLPDRCLNDTGWYVTECGSGSGTDSSARCSPQASRGAFFAEFELAAASVFVAFPAARAQDGVSVNRTALAVEVFGSGRPHDAAWGLLSRLTALVLPHISCPFVHAGGWGWSNHGRRNFSAVVREQIASMTPPRDRSPCWRPPQQALSMRPAALAQYVQTCYRLKERSFQYARESVPVFQLAWFLATFPRAAWTFVRHEAFFGAVPRPDALSRLASRLGRPPRELAATPECHFGNATGAARFFSSSGAGLASRSSGDPTQIAADRSSNARYDALGLAAAFAPWDAVMLKLVRRAVATLNASALGW